MPRIVSFKRVSARGGISFRGNDEFSGLIWEIALTN
jgi:hypothetical protein